MIEIEKERTNEGILMDEVKDRVLMLVNDWNRYLGYVEFFELFLCLYLVLSFTISTLFYPGDRLILGLLLLPIWCGFIARYLQKYITSLNIINHPILCTIIVSYCAPYYWRVKESKINSLLHSSSQYWIKMNTIREKLNLKDTYNFNSEDKDEIESHKNDIMIRMIMADLLPKHKPNIWFFYIRVDCDEMNK